MSQVKGVKDFIKVAGSATVTGRYGEEKRSFAISAFVSKYYLIIRRG
jgi:hypothetical protein